MADLLVKLYELEDSVDYTELKKQNIVIKKAFIGDKSAILDFVKDNFPEAPGWAGECEYALLNNPVSCFIAVKEKNLAGFACYDATARGFFGPLGVGKKFRKGGIGRYLLKRALLSMRELGYAYAVIGWAAENALEFYRKAAGAVIIGDSPPEKSIYKNMIATQW
ncbi:MAG: GNAT family N-acetyltransferase [Spirochaetaceae bacterium]|jgi:ribosomal protein S18 acetylase RimI-like enzyme|nr:GNAT family N-acetyltransferase [Spirochaetaceae bacterium]